MNIYSDKIEDIPIMDNNKPINQIDKKIIEELFVDFDATDKYKIYKEAFLFTTIFILLLFLPNNLLKKYLPDSITLNHINISKVVFFIFCFFIVRYIIIKY